MSDLTAAVDAVATSAAAYAEADSFYRGTASELFASPLIKRIIGRTAEGYRFNLARRPVDAVLDRLKIASVAVPGDEPATALFTQRVWEPNRLGRVAKQLHRGALVHGDAYLVIWPGDEDDTVEVHYNGPRSMRMFYDPENPHRKSHAAKVWEIGESPEKRQIRVNLYYADRIERYVSDPGAKGDDDDQFREFGDDGVAWPIANPFGEVPVFHFRTDEPYGRPEHADAFGPQNAITKLVAVQMSTVDFQGFPQRYRLRADKIVDTAHSGYPDEDGEAADGDDLEGGPGTVLDLADTKAVGSFPAADPEAFLKPLGFVIRAMAAATATPLRFFDPAGQVPSGEALRADDAPLSERIGDRQTWFGDEWRAALVFAARVAGLAVVTVDVRWRPVQIVDDLTGWQTVKAKVDAGVPQEQALMEAGYRPEQVAAWTGESEATNLATRVELLVKIGAAMQSMGAAVALGVISQEQVQQVIADILEDSLPAGEATGDGD